ncbi:hypothetical protein CYMTET_35603 [Cymbomonas tetramitiformis]|uniref:Ankyrin repeat protein n=1 Tax=Cymbomonas tetramitiformis TaxID=36881 RepID=A0AAE0F8V4_9CHLO|nr:hypothetical protein CYMTET_35603 [Cymbomonas tetramitiformis]|eukprot:gene10-15_t
MAAYETGVSKSACRRYAISTRFALAAVGHDDKKGAFFRNSTTIDNKDGGYGQRGRFRSADNSHPSFDGANSGVRKPSQSSRSRNRHHSPAFCEVRGRSRDRRRDAVEDDEAALQHFEDTLSAVIAYKEQRPRMSTCPLLPRLPARLLNKFFHERTFRNAPDLDCGDQQYCHSLHFMIYEVIKLLKNDNAPERHRCEGTLLYLFQRCDDIWGSQFTHGSWMCMDTDNLGNNVYHILCKAGFARVLRQFTIDGKREYPRLAIPSLLWAQKNSDGMVPLEVAIYHSKRDVVDFVMQELDEGGYAQYTVCNRLPHLMQHAIRHSDLVTLRTVSKGCYAQEGCTANYGFVIGACRLAVDACNLFAVRKLLDAGIFDKAVQYDCSGFLVPYNPVWELSEIILRRACDDTREKNFEMLRTLIAHFSQRQLLPSDSYATPMKTIRDLNKMVTDKLLYLVISKSDDVELFILLVWGVMLSGETHMEFRMMGIKACAELHERTRILLCLQDEPNLDAYGKKHMNRPPLGPRNPDASQP